MQFIDEINTSSEDNQQDQQWYDFPIEYPADPATDTHGETNPETDTSPTDHQPFFSAMTSPPKKRTIQEKRLMLHSEGLPADHERRKRHSVGDQGSCTTMPSWRPPRKPCLHAGTKPCLHAGAEPC
ncbi:hypothetical protein JTE90_002271 [Oedothorax gibbosus]|uniref:Uncharacterized protein n=1 Tax=Oedothorax gibbosus TaxID=931172 RepID=A0AAV6UF84_9ARAC|nr:hypothetical protein JTE90_002271 [Oedothorax gibbosus]